MTIELHFILALIFLWVLPLFYASAFDVPGTWTARWWFGAIAAGLIAVISHALKTPKVLNDAALLFFLGAGIVKAALHVRQQPPEFRKSALKAIPWQPLLLLLPLLIAAYLHILRYPVRPADWDAVSLWYKKVKMLYAWFPLKNTPIADWGGNYINYPHLGPMLEVLLMKTSGFFLENFGRLIFPTFYAVWILSLRDLMPPEQKNWRLFLPPLFGYVFFELRPFTNGYQEALLTALAGMSALQFCLFLRNPQELKSPGGFSWFLFLGCFFGGALAFVKSEGMLLSIMMAASLGVTLFAFDIRKGLNFFLKLIPYLLVMAVLVLLWPGLLLWNHADLTHLQNDSFSVSTFSQTFKNLGRASLIGSYFADHWLQKFPVLFLSLLFSAVSLTKAPETRRPIVFLWIVLTGHWVLVALPYFVTGANPVWHLRYSFDRLMFQHLFIYPTLLTLCVSGILGRSSSQEIRP